MRKYYLGPGYPNLYLYPRQARCMAYFILGYSTAKISELLKLSPRTLDAYALDMRVRLNCRSKDEMIAKVKQSGFMGYLDELIS